ncbi:MAG: substrate-binding domain-containing protein [Infirmifilum sp.]
MDKKLLYGIVVVAVLLVVAFLVYPMLNPQPGTAPRQGTQQPSTPSQQTPPQAQQPKEKVVLRISTTTSMDATGLLQAIKQRFEAKYPWINVTWVAVGTGQAIEIAKRGDADLVIVHNRDLENQFIAEGYGVHGITFAYNDFVLLGPPDDPAGVKSAKNAVDAFKKIYAAAEAGKTVFVSRGDRSGTHLRELQLWSMAGVDPKGKPWYKETGQGMSQTLMVADQLNGYTLSDRSTYLAFKDKIHLVILNEGDPLYLNIYRAIPVNPKKFPHIHYNESLLFVTFIVTPEGQNLIGTNVKGGAKLFNVCFGNLTKLVIYDPYEYDQMSGQVVFYQSLIGKS